MFERVYDRRWAKNTVIEAGLVVFAEDIGGEGLGGIKARLTRARRGEREQKRLVKTILFVAASLTSFRFLGSLIPVSNDRSCR
jgi:hypothetical protein